METCARGWGFFPCAWPAGRPLGPSEPAGVGEAGPADTGGRGPADPQGPERQASWCRTGANPQAGVEEGDTLTSLVPRIVVRPVIHSQNRRRKGGREARLEEERMEEEREEGSVGRGLQEPPPGSLETLQPSAGLSAPDAAPAQPGVGVGVERWGSARGTPAARRSPSAAPRRPPLRCGRLAGPALTVPPAARAPVLSRPAAAPCPSSRSSPPPRLSLPGALPPPRAPTDECRPHGAAFKYRARLRRERRPPPALGPESWEEWEGSPEGREEHPLIGSVGGSYTRPVLCGTRGPACTRLQIRSVSARWVGGFSQDGQRPSSSASPRGQLPRRRRSLCST